MSSHSRLKLFVGMENGNGAPAAHGYVTNGHLEPLPEIWYRLTGEPRVRYTPPSRLPMLGRRDRFTYPNDLVLSVDGERRELHEETISLRAEIEALREALVFRNTRIQLLEAQLDAERERTEAARAQTQRYRARLTRVTQDIHARTQRVLSDVHALMDVAVEVSTTAIIEEPPEGDSSEYEPIEGEPAEADPSVEGDPEEDPEEDPPEEGSDGGAADE